MFAQEFFKNAEKVEMVKKINTMLHMQEELDKEILKSKHTGVEKDVLNLRLASRIHDLTEKGYEFDRKIEKVKNRDYETVTYTRYSFKEEREDKKDEH